MMRDDGGDAPLGVGRALTGYGAIAVAVVIWAAWIVWTRQSVAQDYGAVLGPVDLGLLRFGAPALLFAPIWLRGGLKPPSASWIVMLAMFGWGAPFVLLAAEGMKTTSAAHIGALVPGVMPLWAAVFAFLLLRDRLSVDRLIGLGLILGAVAAVIGPVLAAGRGDELTGAPWLLAAAASWALFAIGFKRAGVGPMHAAGIVSVYSVIVLLLIAAVQGSRLGALPLDVLAIQVLNHGVLAGALSIAAYTVAIDRLGAARATSFSALVPVLAAAFGWALLGEALGPWDVLAIGLASLGVALANGVADGALRR